MVTQSETAQHPPQINEGHIKANEYKEPKERREIKEKEKDTKEHVGHAGSLATPSITARITITEDRREAGNRAIKGKDMFGQPSGTRGLTIKARRRCSSVIKRRRR